MPLQKKIAFEVRTHADAYAHEAKINYKHFIQVREKKTRQDKTTQQCVHTTLIWRFFFLVGSEKIK